MGVSNILMLVVLLAVFYALMILPQRKQQKKKQMMQQQLGVGAKILTNSGIYGEVVDINEGVMLVRLAQNVEVEMDARAVLRVVEAAPSASAPAES